MRVLIADDDAATRLVLRKRLADWGYEVVEAEDGRHAWQILTGADPPRLAVLDWMMPGLDGVEVCRRLNERPDGPFVYTILLTARSERQDLVTALNAGAHNFQSKPIAVDELRSHLAVGQRLVERLQRGLHFRPSGVSSHLVDAILLSRLDDLVRDGTRFGVIVLELDRLEWIQSAYGERIADEVFHMVVRALMREVSNPDVVGRWGGKQIVAVVGEPDARSLWQRADRYRLVVERSGLGEGTEVVRTTASIGATLARPQDSPQSLVSRALSMLGKSKAAGGGCVSMDWRQSREPAA